MASRNATALKLPTDQRARALWAKADEHAWLASIMELATEHHRKAWIQGPHVRITCPFGTHEDTNPSCYVTPTKALVKCYGCGVPTVNPVKLVKLLLNGTYADAARWLRKRLGLRGILTDELAEQLDRDAAAAAMRTKIIRFCCDYLKEAFSIIGPGDLDWTDERIDGETRRSLKLTHAGKSKFSEPRHSICAFAIEWLATRYGLDTPDHEPLWRLACDDQLVGVLPSAADAGAYFGPNSAEAHAFSGFFMKQDTQHVGWLVFPRHDVNGDATWAKLRCASEAPDRPDDSVAMPDIMKADYSGDDKVWPGLYGLRAARHSLGGSLQGIVTRAHIMEGESSTFATLAHQIRRGISESLGWVVLGGNGASTPSLDPLADFGISRVSIVQDNDGAGDDRAAEIVDRTRAPSISLEVFDWRDFADETDPRDAVTQVGYPRWATMIRDEPDRYFSVPRWLCGRATSDVAKQRIPSDDVKRRGDVATEWGKLATHPQEVIAYATMTAAILGIDAGALRRAIESRDVLSAAQDHATLARYVLRDLATEAEVRFCEGSFWRYTDGLWRSTDDAAIERAIMDMCKDALKLKASDVHGIRKLAAAQASAPGFFDDARAGVMLANGFLSIDDAGTVALERPSPEHRARIALPIDYNPDATAPRWRRFLLECLSPSRRDWTKRPSRTTRQWPRDAVSAEAISFQDWIDDIAAAAPTIHLLQEFVGVCLFGLATRLKDPRAIVLEGSGANGKSVFLDVIKDLFPQSWSAIEPQAWDHPYNRHALVGKRINLVSELPSREVMSSAHVKQIITGDPTSARDPYKSVVNFRPIAGHLLLANELPSVADSSHGYWRRQIVISWPHRFEGDTAEAGLADRIVRAELAGVVAWAVQGATRLLRRDRKYIVPEASELAVAEWKRDSDPVAMWLETATRTPDASEGGEGLSVLYLAYDAWSKLRGYHPISEITFARRLAAAGVERDRTTARRLWKRRLMDPRAGMAELRA